MTKSEFLSELKRKLAQLPDEEADKSIGFYSEMIEDRIEDGMSEEDAVASMEEIDKIAEQIIADTPLPLLIKTRTEKRTYSGMNIAMLIIGSPLWFTLLLVSGVLILTMYIVVWTLVVSVVAVVGAIAVAGLAAIVGGIISFFALSLPTALGTLGMGLACAGLSILLFFPAKKAVLGIISFSALVGRKAKTRIFRQKGDNAI